MCEYFNELMDPSFSRGNEETLLNSGLTMVIQLFVLILQEYVDMD